MAFYSEREIRNEAQRVTRFDASGAGGVLRKTAASGPFDIFLSHSFYDAELILGVKRALERTGKKVYVDWIDDPLLDRRYVTASNAHMLRQRMRQSASMIFATSDTSSNSKWMPWELGFFDGYKGSESVAIMPIVAFAGGQFAGQEYLGLYPLIEQLQDPVTQQYRPTIAKRAGLQLRTKSLEALVQGRDAYTTR